jgi:hypothetical protein
MAKRRKALRKKRANETVIADRAGAARISVLTPSRRLAGQDKWLGGAVGPNGCVYGIPGSAQSVLKIDPATSTVSTIPFHRDGRFKWLRGYLLGDGHIYGVPANADCVLRINPMTDAVDVVGEGLFSGRWQWHGGVVHPADGALYCIPCNAESVLRISRTGEVSTFGHGHPLLRGKAKWYGGLLGCDGSIYGIPNCADRVLKLTVVPGTDEAAIEAIGRLPKGGRKWHGGVACSADGCIYGAPSHADSVLRIDVRRGEVTMVGGPPDPNVAESAAAMGGTETQGGTRSAERGKVEHWSRGAWRPNGKYKYGGGVEGADGRVFFFPSDADRVLRVTGSAEGGAVVEAIGPAHVGCHNKWQNGMVLADGTIVAIPCNARSVLVIGNGGETVETVPIDGDLAAGHDKWEGGVAHDGELFCIPQASKSVIRISPAPDKKGRGGAGYFL